MHLLGVEWRGQRNIKKTNWSAKTFPFLTDVNKSRISDESRLLYRKICYWIWCQKAYTKIIEVMVWKAIMYGSRSCFIFIRSQMIAALYIEDVLLSTLLSLRSWSKCYVIVTSFVGFKFHWKCVGYDRDMRKLSLLHHPPQIGIGDTWSLNWLEKYIAIKHRPSNFVDA